MSALPPIADIKIGSDYVRRAPHRIPYVRWRLNSSGNFAMLTAIRLASSRSNNFAAVLRPAYSRNKHTRALFMGETVRAVVFVPAPGAALSAWACARGRLGAGAAEALAASQVPPRRRTPA